jgi:hypothetical protein
MRLVPKRLICRFDFPQKPVEVGPVVKPTIGHHGADATADHHEQRKDESRLHGIQ